MEYNDPGTTAVLVYKREHLNQGFGSDFAKVQ